MKLLKVVVGASINTNVSKVRNDGQGLRTFKYANGLAYLTEVVVEPKVEINVNNKKALKLFALMMQLF